MQKNGEVGEDNLLEVLAKVQGHDYNVITSVTRLQF